MRRVWHVLMSAGVYESLGEGTMVVWESVIGGEEAVEAVRGGEGRVSEVEVEGDGVVW